MASSQLPAAVGDALYAKPPETVVAIVSHQTIFDDFNQPLHTIYTIETKTTLSTFTKNHCTVTRRYSDFVWLRRKLVEQTEQSLARITIPSLPSDTWSSMIWKSARFDPQFIAERKEALRQFLDLVTHNPSLMYSRIVQQFLEDPDFKCE